LQELCCREVLPTTAALRCGAWAAVRRGGSFVLADGSAFPSVTAIRSIMAAGGFGANGWAPLSIDGVVLAEWLRRAPRPATAAAEGASGDAAVCDDAGLDDECTPGDRIADRFGAAVASDCAGVVGC
jgi:hypothetical protein